MSGLFDSLMRTIRGGPETSTGPVSPTFTATIRGADLSLSSGELTTADVLPSGWFIREPGYSATGRVYDVIEAGRELLKEIDECRGTTASPSPDILQRFRDLVEPR